MADVSEMLSSLPDDKIGKIFGLAIFNICSFTLVTELGDNDKFFQLFFGKIKACPTLTLIAFNPLSAIVHLNNIFPLFLDMIAATSVLQQQAGDIRINKINWQSYMQYV